MPVWNSDLHYQMEVELATWWEAQQQDGMAFANPFAHWHVTPQHINIGLIGGSSVKDINRNGRSLGVPNNATLQLATEPGYIQFSTSNCDTSPITPPTGAVTLGGWFSVDAPQSGVRGLISCGLASISIGAHNWGLLWSGNQVQFAIANAAGTTYQAVTSAASPAIGAWFFVAGRFTPATELAIFINDAKTAVATSIAETEATQRVIGVGQLGAGFGRLSSGKCHRAWVVAQPLADKDIQHIYSRQKALFGH